RTGDLLLARRSRTTEPQGDRAEAREPYLGHTQASVAQARPVANALVQPSQAARWITDARFAPYLALAGGDHAGAVSLYVWNAQISAAAFETLHHVEVLLRNAVDEQFTPVDPSATVGATWLTDPAILNEASRRRVSETVERVRREGKSPTRGRVVAGLSFAFWRALFDRKYERLWVAQLHRAFPAGSGQRTEVAKLMSNLVPFRNRLAHHETIVRRPIASHYEEILTLAALIDPDARVWLESVSRVDRVLAERPDVS
ncbi:MAG TPA: hypothetical protein VEJ23_03875, partial [Solirubrobacteraceae bacterium]|nr:hypothetical protein [Solirubrobacteraceae bacterium]